MDRAAAERLDRRLRLLAQNIEDNMAKLYSLIREAGETKSFTLLGFSGMTEYLADVFVLETRLSVEQRREMVGYLSGEGLSQRAIGGMLGVSHGTVGNDLGAQGGQNYPPPTDPETRRKVVEHMYEKGFSQAAIADGLGAPRSTVSGDVSRSRSTNDFTIGLDGVKYPRRPRRPGYRPSDVPAPNSCALNGDDGFMGMLKVLDKKLRDMSERATALQAQQVLRVLNKHLGRYTQIVNEEEK